MATAGKLIEEKTILDLQVAALAMNDVASRSVESAADGDNREAGEEVMRSRVFGLAFAAVLLETTQAPVVSHAQPIAAPADSLELACSGSLEFGRAFLSTAAEPRLDFEVSVQFGEGEILALVDPETSKVETVLYDAEVTSGLLRFKGGDDRRIIWTRMSGLIGPLVGQAVASDGDIIALSIERRTTEADERPFALFAAAGGSAYRGVCHSRARSD